MSNGPIRILTIDDEESIRTSFRLYLEDFDYEVLEAKNGREGLALFTSEKPDLVLCDLRMPEVDGLEVLSRVRESSPDTPIIVVSGTGVISDAIEAVQCGAWNYLLKPIQNFSTLHHAVEQALERARLIRENRTYQTQLEEEVISRTQDLQETMEDLKNTNYQVKMSEERYRSIYENLQDVYFEILLDGEIREVSPSINRISDYTNKELIGDNVWQFYPRREDRERFIDDLKQQGYVSDYELQLRDRGGRIIPCSINARLIAAREDRPSIICGTLRDISERKLAEAHIERLAYYDALTDLPNRRLLIDRLERDLARARRHKHYGAMLFLDLDRFKNINDSLGHHVGDALLEEVARRLTSDLRLEDTVSRLGGDEFIMLLADMGTEPSTAASQTQAKAEQVQKHLSQPYKVLGHDLHITPSIGVAIFPSDDDPNEDGNDILRHADTAMYRAKDDGRDLIRFFLPSMQAAADQRLSIEKDLRFALERNEMQLYFQPQVDGKGQIVGAETLLRWQHPEKGFISPADFIPVAEATGLILPIGLWVLEMSCWQIKKWSDAGLSIGHLAVNVSPRQFRQPGFISQIHQVVAKTGADAQQLGLELTEGMVIDNINDTIEKMQGLKSMGIELSIDDFGTGYSSLAYLKRLPLDIIKIDQSFVRDIQTDAGDAAIVETIIAMAHHLGLRVIAEGVETDFEFDFLNQRNCRGYQGYYFSRPIPEAAFTSMLASNKPLPLD
ncbi:EAL domain-containing protein [Geopsychrobacter electrodiphilus]|uniref:EAL domain-containing protein n=1 Tax=Geopsychrobacter electrodiphilus TaxID=225196 RepID=UPI00035C0D0F|nr:EAL domain-containing protein [Geopsychrobacter electrodiphilus]